VQPPTIVDRIVRHERLLLGMTLLAVCLGCWAWIVPMARDMYGAMSGPAAWMMTADWDAPHLLLLGAMWTVMMAGMMLPSALPLMLVYAGAARRRADGRPGVGVPAMAAGYVLVWTGFSVGATLLQRILSAGLVLSPMMEARSPLFSAALLIAAGVYQLTPLKRSCLASCSAPIDFLMRRWRDGASGAFRMCVGCCWALMLLLFAGGVMNLAVIGALTAFVLVEKLTPLGLRGARLTGLALIALGVWVLATRL